MSRRSRADLHIELWLKVPERDGIKQRYTSQDLEAFQIRIAAFIKAEGFEIYAGTFDVKEHVVK